MLADLRKSTYPAELGLLLAFCIFLPLVEMPKNLAWLLYVIAWLVNRFRAGELGSSLFRSWDAWDSLFAAWIASGYLVAAFSGLQGTELGGAHELARYAVLGWMVKRAGYSAQEMRWLMGALIASTIAGLAFGYWRIVSGASKSGSLQLHSVGHVNHTAIYIAIILGVCASWTFARWPRWSPGRRSVGLSVFVLLLVSLVYTASRGAVGVGFVLVLVLAAAWWRRWRLPLAASLVGVAIATAVVLGTGADLVRKHEQFAGKNNALSSRDGIWRMALAAWERYPWFGIGMDNYSQLTHERVRAWRAEAGKDYDESRFVQHAHAHNLFVNALAERGIVGFAALAAVILAWAIALVRRRPAAQDRDAQWLAWGASASAWAVTVGVGMVNTTLHHEHGLLAALLLGLWLSSLAPRRGS